MGPVFSLLLMVVGIGSGLVFTKPGPAPFPTSYLQVAGALFAFPVTVPLLMWLLSRRYPPNPKWARPSFRSNPLDFAKSPLTLFLVVGATFLVSGGVGLCGRLIRGLAFDLSPLYFLAVGIGVLVGLKVAVYMFRNSIEQSN